MSKSIKLKDDFFWYGTIIERGQNDDECYLKFSDGSLICFGEFTINLEFKAWGNVAGGDWKGSHNFPATFKSVPILLCNTCDQTFAGGITRAICSKTTITTISIMRPSSSSNIDYKLNYIAIGKWK